MTFTNCMLVEVIVLLYNQVPFYHQPFFHFEESCLVMLISLWIFRVCCLFDLIQICDHLFVHIIFQWFYLFLKYFSKILTFSCIKNKHLLFSSKIMRNFSFSFSSMVICLHISTIISSEKRFICFFVIRRLGSNYTIKFLKCPNHNLLIFKTFFTRVFCSTWVFLWISTWIIHALFEFWFSFWRQSMAIWPRLLQLKHLECLKSLFDVLFLQDSILEIFLLFWKTFLDLKFWRNILNFLAM